MEHRKFSINTGNIETQIGILEHSEIKLRNMAEEIDRVNGELKHLSGMENISPLFDGLSIRTQGHSRFVENAKLGLGQIVNNYRQAENNILINIGQENEQFATTTVSKSIPLYAAAASPQASSGTITKTSSPTAFDKEGMISYMMEQLGLTREEAELLCDAMNKLYNSVPGSESEKLQYVYGTLSALCISYDAKRWRATTGQPFLFQAINRLKLAGFTDQQILDLRVLINLQHGDFSDATLLKHGIDISKSSFANETNAQIRRRSTDGNIDFAHMMVQMTAFARIDSKTGVGPLDALLHPVSSAVDAFNAEQTMYEISFKGDIDSCRYSEADFQSDIDAINIYYRQRNGGGNPFQAFSDYYNDINADSTQRAKEFFRNMGDGYEDIGILNTSEIIEKETPGSQYIQSAENPEDVKKAKQVFMQWLMSIYEGVEYDFPEN